MRLPRKTIADLRRAVAAVAVFSIFIQTAQAVIVNPDDIPQKETGDAISAGEFNTMIDTLRGVKKDDNDTAGLGDDKIGLFLPDGVNPTQQLHVNGTVKATYFMGDGSNLTNLPDVHWVKSGNDVNYPTGRVGVGIASPNTKLEVKDGAIRATANNSNNNYVEMAHSGSNAYLNFAGTGNLDFRRSGATEMTLTSAGRLGIGTSNPQAVLHVNGDLIADNIIPSGGGGPIAGTQWNDVTGGIDYSAGNVGIGATTPLSKLQVKNTTAYTLGEADFPTDSIGLYGSVSGVNGSYFGGITWHNDGRRRGGIASVMENADADHVGLAFFTQGADGPGPMAESMRISHDGNVGINTTTPSERLQVVGQAEIPEVIFAQHANGTTDKSSIVGAPGIVQIHSDGAIDFYESDAGAQKFRFNVNNGRLGVGTNNPQNEIHVVGTIRADNFVDDLGDPIGDGLWTENGTNIYYQAGRVGIGSSNAPSHSLDIFNGGARVSSDLYQQGSSGNGFIMHSRASSSYDFWQLSPINAGTNDWAKGITLVRAEGNVGISNTTPGHRLDVDGNIRSRIGRIIYFGTADQRISGDNDSAFYQNSNNSTVIQTIYRDKENTVYGRVYGSGNGTNFGLLDGDGNWAIQSVKDNNINFRVNNTERMRIQNNGRVGIGTNSPNSKLEVVGTIRGGDASATSGSLGFGIRYTANDVPNTFGAHYSTGATVLGYGIRPKSGSSGYVSSAGNVAWPRGALTMTDALVFSSAGSSSVAVGNDVALAERFRVHTNGNIGIDRAAPSHKLDVDGNIRTRVGRSLYFGTTNNQSIYGDNSSAYYMDSNHDSVVQQIFRDRQNTTYGRIYGDGNGANFGLIDGDGEWGIRMAKDTDIQFRINNDEKMRITSSGSVGIGDDTPDGGMMLDVEGKIGAIEYCDQNGNNCSSFGRSGFTASGSSSTADDWSRLVTIDMPGSNYQDGTIMLAIVGEEINEPGTAIVSIAVRQRTNPSMTMSAEIMEIHNAPIDIDGIKLTSNGFGTDVQVWIKSKKNYQTFDVYEIARNTAELGAVTYEQSSPWQASEPSGSAYNVYSRGSVDKYTRYVKFSENDNQFIYGDGDSAFYTNSAHSTVVQNIFRDRENTVYGRIYGDGNGANFGLLDGDGNWGILMAKDNRFEFRLNDDEKMRILSSNGNVGINNTTPGHKLDVDGNIRTRVGRSVYFGTTNNQNIYGDNSSAFYTRSNHSTVVQNIYRDAQNTVYGRVYGSGDGANFGLLDGDGEWAVQSVKDNNINFRVNNSEIMRVSSGGNVGIGTTSPSAALEVYADRDITANPETKGIRLRESAGDWLFSLGVSGVTNTGFSIRDNVTDTYPLTIRETSNNVGINNTGPGHKLDVDGNIRSRVGRSVYFGTTNNQNIYGDNSSAYYMDSNHDTVIQQIFRDRQNTTYGRIYGDGNGANFGLIDGDGDWGIQMQKDSNINFRINNTERMRLSGNSELHIGSNHLNVANYNFNGTPTNGIKIRTNLPYTNGSQMPTVVIEGYNYGQVKPIGIILNWYIYGGNFYNYRASSYGGYAPTIRLANESGKVVIYIDDRQYYNRFNVRVYAQGMGGVESDVANFQNWTIVDQALTGGNQVTFSYENEMGNLRLRSGRVLSFGTGDQRLYGDNGSALYYTSEHSSVTQQIFRDQENTVYGRIYGDSNGANFGLLDGDGNWGIRMEKDNNIMFLINNNEHMRLRSNGRLGLGTTNPSSRLEVIGDIEISGTVKTTSGELRCPVDRVMVGFDTNGIICEFPPQLYQ